MREAIEAVGLNRIGQGRALVRGATEGFDGNMESLSQAAGVSRSSLNIIQSGVSQSSAAARMLLAILASNPNQARRLCDGARKWMSANGIIIESRVGNTQKPRGKVAPPPPAEQQEPDPEEDWLTESCVEAGR